MYVVKEPLGLGHPPKPHPSGFYSGKEEEGRGHPFPVQLWFLYQEVRTSANPELGFARPPQTLPDPAQVGWGQGSFCPALAGIFESLWSVAGQSVDRLQRRYQQVGDGGWQWPRGEITACVWGGGPGGLCLWAQVELHVPQYFLRGHLESHGQHTVDFQVAALGTELDAEPEGQVMGVPSK